MDSFMKNSFLEFKTLAPVYIGCGRTAGKKEYLVDRKAGKIEILQMNKVFDRIRALGLEEKFERYLLASTPGELRFAGNELADFVRDNHIPPSEYGSWSSEIVGLADQDINFHSVKDISLFVRNERGLPFIPGSGFKGMLRTVLEADYYLRERASAEEKGGRIRRAVQSNEYDQKRRDKFLVDEDRALDVESMHEELFQPQKDESPEKNLKDQKNDILRGLLVGDSEPLSWDDMCVCQKIDLNIYGETRPLNVLREAIRPYVTVRIPISIDTRICRYSMTDILGAIRNFNTNYISEFARKYPDAPATNGNSTTFFLGGGTGYVSKTVTYAVLHGDDAVRNVSKIIDATLGPKAKKEHGHANDPKKGVSPHMIKCTKFKGKLYQMGACCITKYG